MQQAAAAAAPPAADGNGRWGRAPHRWVLAQGRWPHGARRARPAPECALQWRLPAPPGAKTRCRIGVLPACRSCCQDPSLLLSAQPPLGRCCAAESLWGACGARAYLIDGEARPLGWWTGVGVCSGGGAGRNHKSIARCKARRRGKNRLVKEENTFGGAAALAAFGHCTVRWPIAHYNCQGQQQAGPSQLARQPHMFERPAPPRAALGAASA